MSDEPRLEVTRRDENTSLSLANVPSGLIARGRRDAALLTKLCKKCGERKELVFADCLCASCSDAFDRQWADSAATDWVLVAFRGPEPPKIKGIYTRSSWFSLLWESYDEGAISREAVERGISEDPYWPILYFYANTTHAQMKSHWADCDPPDSLCIGPMTIDELAMKDDDAVYAHPWPRGRTPIRDAVPYVRPATPREIARHVGAG